MKTLRIFILLTITGFILNAQILERAVIGTLGGDIVNGDLSLSYTVGEIAVNTLDAGSIILTEGFQQPTNNLMQISGYVTYANNISSPLGSLQLNLIDENSNIIQSATTNATGYYVFSGVNPGEYTISTQSSILHGGVNSTDALAVQNHSILTLPLTGINLSSGDVNLSNVVNSTDGLLVRQRFIGLITSFSSGDWLFETTSIDATQGDVLYDYVGICYGDVNASYIPGQLRILTLVELEQQEELNISSNGEYQIPFYINKNVEINAVSLVINFPNHLMKIVDVEFLDNKKEEMIFNVIDGEIRVSWLGSNPIFLSAGDFLFSLIIETKEIRDIASLYFSVNQNESEFADAQAQSISKIELIYPKLILNENICQLEVYPNPFSTTTNVSYSIVEDSSVKIYLIDLNGRLVSELESGEKKTGNYQFELNADKFTSGTYHLMISIEDQIFSKKIVVTD